MGGDAGISHSTIGDRCAELFNANAMHLLQKYRSAVDCFLQQCAISLHLLGCIANMVA
jgi:hypothetical protein